jgi:hypothetical protein
MKTPAIFPHPDTCPEQSMVRSPGKSRATFWHRKSPQRREIPFRLPGERRGQASSGWAPRRRREGTGYRGSAWPRGGLGAFCKQYQPKNSPEVLPRFIKRDRKRVRHFHLNSTPATNVDQTSFSPLKRVRHFLAQLGQGFVNSFFFVCVYIAWDVWVHK